MALPPRPDLSRFQMTAGFMLTPTRFLESCHERMGDYFTLQPQPGRTLVVTVDPEAVKTVFSGDPDVLRAGEGNIVLAPVLGSGSVLLLDGAEHLRHRRMMLPPFHGERMRAYGDAIAEVAEERIARWPRGRAFPALPEMQAITLDVIMRAVFGLDDPARRRAIGAPLRRLLDSVGTRGRVLLLALTSGRTGRLSPWARFARVRREADAVLYEEIARRRADSGAAEGDDVFSLLLAARDEDGEPLTDAELRDELMTLLIAGHETTATALAWALERLVRTPAVLQRLLEEERAGDDAYLDAVVKEVLRVRPVLSIAARRVVAPFEVGGHVLPPGVHVAPCIYLAHRRPQAWPEPTAFRPERFLDGAPAPGTYLPFGGGVRRCAGAAFASLELREVLRAVLERFALAPAGQHTERMIRGSVTLRPSRGGMVLTEPLQPSRPCRSSAATTA